MNEMLSCDTHQLADRESREFAALSQSLCEVFKSFIGSLELAKKRCSVRRVHKLRRACRRLQSAAKLCDGLLEASSSDLIQAQFKKILQATSELRDLHITRDLIEASFRNEALLAQAGTVTIPKTFQKSLKKRIALSERRTRRKVNDVSSKELIKGFAFLLGRLQWQFSSTLSSRPLTQPEVAELSVRNRLQAGLDRMIASVVKSSGSTEKPKKKDIHALRVRFKRYRYAAEFAHSYFPALAGRTEQFDRWQDDFGRVQDLKVAKKIIRQTKGATALLNIIGSSLEHDQMSAFEHASSLMRTFASSITTERQALENSPDARKLNELTENDSLIMARSTPMSDSTKTNGSEFEYSV